MTEADVAYLIDLINRDCKKETPLKKELQKIYSLCQSRRFGGRIHAAIFPTLTVTSMLNDERV